MFMVLPDCVVIWQTCWSVDTWLVHPPGTGHNEQPKTRSNMSNIYAGYPTFFTGYPAG